MVDLRESIKEEKFMTNSFSDYMKFSKLVKNDISVNVITIRNKRTGGCNYKLLGVTKLLL